MAEDRAFVYVVCGGGEHVRTLHRSLEYLRPRTAYPIVVVTDARRNQISIEHELIIDVETPRRLDNHQASIFLKTNLHRLLPRERDHAYLDSDIVVTDARADSIFDHQGGPITFAHDLTRLENRVATFSPWAVRCLCHNNEGQACSHLSIAIHRKFGIRVRDDWIHWNGGVFLFGGDSAPFMDTWHRLTMEIFEDPYWKTRDQGTLIATAWKLGLQHQPCLPQQFNFIIDDNNTDLCFRRKTGYSLHESIPGIYPTLLHLYHADLGRPGWNLARDVEDILEGRTQARARTQELQARTRGALSAISERLTRRPSAHRPPTLCQGGHANVRIASSPPTQEELAPQCPVIVSVPFWSLSGNCVFAEALVRGLRARGTDAQLLLTELNSERAEHDDACVPPPLDLPVIRLPLEEHMSWGSRWGALVRYLEERAPCIYLPIADWRHSNVSPRLSNRVGIVGIVPNEDPRHLDHAERLGRYWNAIVSPSATVAALLAERQPALSDRIVRIAPGVVVPNNLLAGAKPTSGPLRMIYHGRLIQYQKRILDLPKIAGALTAMGIPVELTVIGDGPDRGLLLANSLHLLKQGTMRYLGALSHEKTLNELECQHVYLLTSEFEGMPQALIEAMARGCIPVVSATSGGISELVVEGVNGYRVPVGDIEHFCRRLETLYREPDRRNMFTHAAHQAVITNGLRTDDMVNAFLAVFARIMRHNEDGAFRRPQGLLRKPPYQVAGTEIFPIHYFRGVNEVGVFPSYRKDYEDFRHAIGEPLAHELPEWRPALAKMYPVIVAASSIPSAAADHVPTSLAQGLRRVDQLGHVLVASGARAWRKSMRFGDGVPVFTVPNYTPWCPLWRSLEKHLNRHAPCLYLISDEWLSWRISPRLSPEVGVIARIDDMSPQTLEHVSTMCPYWDVLVAGNEEIAKRVIEIDPKLSSRVVTIPESINFPEFISERAHTSETRLRTIVAGNSTVLSDLMTALTEGAIPVDLTRFENQRRTLFSDNEVFVVLEYTERLRIPILHAMSQGCVPIVARGSGSIGNLIEDGENGYLVPDGDLHEFATRLRGLQKNTELCRELAARAFRTIDCGGYRTNDMVTSYMMLFERVLRDIEFGHFRRPVSEIS